MEIKGRKTGEENEIQKKGSKEMMEEDCFIKNPIFNF